MTPRFEHSPQKIKAAPDVKVVRFPGRVPLNQATLRRIRDQLLTLAEDSNESDLLLDFSNVDYLSGAILGALVSLHNKLSAMDRHLTVVNLTPQVHEVFAVMGLDRLLDLHLAGAAVAAATHDGLQQPRIESP
jgi:anti-anti-sigma factor